MTGPAITEAPVLKTPKVITGTTEVTDKKGRKFFPTKFVVECEVKYRLKKMDDDVEVIFEIDGHYLASFNVNSEKPVATLDEAYLVGNLGKEVGSYIVEIVYALIDNYNLTGWSPVSYSFQSPK